MKRATKLKPKGPRKLTRDERMEAAQFTRLADTVLSIPFTQGPKPDHPLYHPRRDVPLRPLMLSDMDRWALADLLYRLAEPDALKALTATLRVPERRGPKPKTDNARQWRAVLEHELCPERAKQTAHGWAIPVQRLYQWHKELRAQECLPGTWHYWAVYELRRFRATSKIIPSKRPAAFIKYLRSFR